MASIHQEINYILSKDIAVQKCLNKEIINTRSLAKMIIKENNLSYTLDAVISAIRRSNFNKTTSLNQDKINQAFSNMNIATKDNVAMIILKDKAFKEICEDFLTKKALKENIRLIKAKEHIVLIINQKDIEKKVALFKPADIISISKNLSEIRLEFNQNIIQIKGIIARITAELALRDINIEEVITGPFNWMVYIKEKDLISAHQILIEIKETDRNKKR